MNLLINWFIPNNDTMVIDGDGVDGTGLGALRSSKSGLGSGSALAQVALSLFFPSLALEGLARSHRVSGPPSQKHWNSDPTLAFPPLEWTTDSP